MTPLSSHLSLMTPLSHMTLHMTPSLPYDTLSLPYGSVMCVSCLTKEGIKELQEKIYLAAIQAKDPDTNELIIGQQVINSGSLIN